MKTQSSPYSERGDAGAIPRLEFRIKRLRATYRFSFAFHARELRFERALPADAGFESVFPETFSFHADRHDPAELYLRFDDLWTNPRRLHPDASRRDAEELIFRLLDALPQTLSAVLDRLAGGAAFARAAEDVAVLCLVVQRFMSDRKLSEHPRLRLAGFQYAALSLRALLALVETRVSPDFLARYMAGEERSADPDDSMDAAFFYALAGGDAATRDRQITGAAERAYHRWLEEVCLDTGQDAFETERAFFEERETEVLRAVAPAVTRARRGRDLSPFLCRVGSRDCLRLLGKLELYFLRRYDVHHAAVMRHHAENLRAGRLVRERRLSIHGAGSYLWMLLLPSLPFIGAIFAYERAPRVFDGLISLQIALLLGGALWLLVYRFLWRRDLTFFHTSVPRIGAGIIVGYLPVFLIDEVWDLAEQPPFHLFAVILLLGATTFLYLYVEVQSRLGDPQEAFARARSIFMLGLVQAAAFGMLVTSLLGPLMAGRNWGPVTPAGGPASVEALREMSPFLGELPRLLGTPPLLAFPTAVLLMSFLSFFIGTFLQLLWEELPITEPL